jgi:hypothetical protein
MPAVIELSEPAFALLRAYVTRGNPWLAFPTSTRTERWRGPG